MEKPQRTYRQNKNSAYRQTYLDETVEEGRAPAFFPHLFDAKLNSSAAGISHKEHKKFSLLLISGYRDWRIE